MGAEWRSQRRHEARGARHITPPLIHPIDDFLTREYFLVDFKEFPNPTMFPNPLKWVLIKFIDEKIEKLSGGVLTRRRFATCMSSK
jgi:hypothetical protein